MFTRSVKLAVFLMSAAMVACSQHDELLLEGEADGTEIVTSVTVSTPELFGASRSVPDGVYTPAGEGTTPITLYPGRSGMSSFGGVSIMHTGKDDKGNDITWYESVSNVDLNVHPLTYTVGVYVATTTGEGESATTTYTLVDKQNREKHTDSKASFNFHLLKGRPYKIVAYADYAETAKENLEEIPVTFGLNDELKDAFFASQDFTASEQLNVVLRRPFGKLRLMAGDFNTFNAGNKYKINKIKVTFKKPYMLGSTKFNALYGTFDKEDQLAGDVNVEAKPVAYAMEYDADGKADTAAVFTMYLPANFTNSAVSEHGTLPDGSIKYIEGDEIPDSWMYPFDVTVEYDEAASSGAKNLTHTRSFDVDIPVKRNWLTTVHTGEFWTDNSNITVSIDHRFQGEINYTPEGIVVNTPDELQTEINKIVNSTPNADGWRVGHIMLGADIDAAAKTVGRVGAFVVDTYSLNGGFKDNGAKVQIYLDLDGHTISSSGVTGNPKGIISVENMWCTVHIDDSSEAANGKIEYTGNAAKGYPLVYCTYGGQAVINGGKFVSSSGGPAIYVYESEQAHVYAQRFAYAVAGISVDSAEPDDAKKALIRSEVEKRSSKVVINGGWFENGQPNATAENAKVCINSYNVRRLNGTTPNTCWEKYKNTNTAYGDWAAWGEYPVDNKTIKGITFGYVYLNGGSYVNFNPATGDNMLPDGETDKSWMWGMMDRWVDSSKFKVLSSVVEGKTVYTVVPKTAPNGETPHVYPSNTL